MKNTDAHSGMTEDWIIDQFVRPRFGAFTDDGEIILFPDRGWETHPLANRARWIGGLHDTEIARAVIAMLKRSANRE